MSTLTRLCAWTPSSAWGWPPFTLEGLANLDPGRKLAEPRTRSGTLIRLCWLAADGDGKSATGNHSLLEQAGFGQETAEAYAGLLTTCGT